MSHFVSPDQTKKVELGDGEFIELRTSISWQENQQIVTVLNEKGEAEGGLEQLSLFIKSWNLKEDGKEVELKKENIRRLDIKTVNIINEQILEYMKSLSSKKK